MHLILWVVHDHITDWSQTGTREGQKRHKSPFSTLYELGRPAQSAPFKENLLFMLTGSLVTHLQGYTMTQMIICLPFMFIVSQPIKKDSSHKTARIKPESPGATWVLTTQNIFLCLSKTTGTSHAILTNALHYIFFLIELPPFVIFWTNSGNNTISQDVFPTNSGFDTGFNIRILAQRHVYTLTKRGRYRIIAPLTSERPRNQSAINAFIQICLEISLYL